MGTHHSNFKEKVYGLQITMATRTLRNRPAGFPVQQKPGKAIATNGFGRKVLGDITSGQNIVKPSIIGKPKEKVVINNEQESESMDIDEVVCGLPAGVADIDSKDLDNPQLCAEYVTETFAYLRGLERLTLVGGEHLAGQPTNDKMRSVLVDWLVEVQVQFKLLQETLFSTVDIIDRFMAIEGVNITRAKLQLVGVASMFLASKIEEVYAPACSDFVYITDNAYSEAEIKTMELKIVAALDFSLAQPTAINFLRRISKAGDVDVLQHSLAKYTLELSMGDYTMVKCPGSQLAAAALCLSLLVLEQGSTENTVWTPTLAYYSGYTKEQVMPLVRRHAANILKIHKPTSKLQAVRTKYRSSKFLKVSEMTELCGEVVLNLAN